MRKSFLETAIIAGVGTLLALAAIFYFNSMLEANLMAPESLQQAKNVASLKILLISSLLGLVTGIGILVLSLIMANYCDADVNCDMD